MAIEHVVPGLGCCEVCGKAPAISGRNPRCRSCWSRGKARTQAAVGAISERWPSLSTRLVRQLARAAAWATGGSAVPWVQGLADQEVLAVRNVGKKSLAELRAAVPAPFTYRQEEHIMVMGGEMVRATLQLLCDNWDRTPVRVVQDGRWQSLYLSEIADQEEVARQVIRFLTQRHLSVVPDPAE